MVHPFDVPEEDAGEDDILWLASTGVSGSPDQQKLYRWVAKSLNLCCFFYFFIALCFCASSLSV